MSTQQVERDEQLLSVGTQCSAPSCLLIDFLPFKCQHCNKPYCAEHFTVEGHKCDQYDEHKHNRVAPNCPLCNEPVAIKVGENPNVRMELHIERECSVMTGKAKKKSAPTCANKKCSKVLFAPIRCDKCRQQFCPAHRFPSDHACVTTSAQPAPKPTSASTATSLNTKVSAASGAVKQKLAATATQAKTAMAASTSKSSASASTSKSSPSLPGPFNKTDRPSLPLPESAVPVTEIKSAAPPVIDPLAFKPRSIFGLA